MMNNKISFLLSKLNLVAGLAILVLTIPMTGTAQDITSAIRGTVTESGGSGVSYARVTITHTPTGTRRTVQTDQNGNYSASGLRVGGPYTIRIDSDSHRSASYDNVYLSLADTMNLDTELGGAVIEEVVVVGIAIEATSTTGSASVFNRQFVEDTAAFNRDLKDIIKRNPFSVILPGSEAPLSIAGINPAYNNLTIDGVKQNDDFGLNDNGYPSQRSPISLETVEQLSVNVSPFSPRYGGFSGGHINVVTKSGTNEFHGSVFFENINDSRSGTPKLPDGTRVDLEFEEETYGGYISGPIIKDKLFFLASYEFFETPLSVEWGPGGSSAPNQARISEADLAEVIRIADIVYGVDAGDWDAALVEEDEKIFLKLDWNINDNHRAAFSYQFTEGNATANTTSSRFELKLSTHWYNRGEELESYAAHLFSNWTDRFSTEFKVVDKSVKNTQAPIDLSYGDVVVETASGNVAFGADHSRHANRLNNSTTQFVAHGNFYIGDHSIGFGVDYQDVEIFNLFAQTSLGDFHFESIADFQNRNLNVPGAFFNYFNAFTNVAADAGASFSLAELSLYVEDIWQVTESLQLAFGVRFEEISNDQFPAENANFITRYNFSNLENLDGADNVLPRFGFDWDATDRLRVSAGIGKYGGGRPNVWISNSYANDGVTYTTFDRTVVDPLDYLTNVDISTIPASVQANMLAGDGNVNAIQPGFEVPTDWRYKLGLEYLFDIPALGDDWVANFDILYMDSDEGLHWTELARVDTGRTTADGGRIIREPIDRLTNQPTQRYDLLLGNAPGGDSTVMSLSLAKDWESGFSMYAAYANQDTSEGNPGTSSTATSNFQFNAVLDRQFPTFGPAAYEIEHRFTLDLRYRYAFFGEYETRINLFFERRSGVPFSWTMDAFGSQDFGDVGTFASGGTYYLPYLPSGPPGVDDNVRYVGITYDDLFAEMERAGLTGFAGGYAPKNAGRTPYITTIDLRLEQEIPGFSSNHRGVFYLEILNFYNLIDSDKGKVLHNQFRSSQRSLVGLESIDPVTNQYVYGLPFRGFNTDANWDEFVSEESQWRMKVGLRYRF